MEPQGSHQVVALNLSETIVKMIVSAETRVNPGDKIGIGFNIKRIHFFNKETENRIPMQSEAVS